MKGTKQLAFLISLIVSFGCLPVLAQESFTGSKHITVNGTGYDVYVANLAKQHVRLHLIDDKTGKHFLTVGAVKNNLEGQGKRPLMIMNAGMFTKVNDPLGLYIEESGKHHSKLNTYGTSSKGNFYLQPNGVFYIDANGRAHIDTTKEVGRLQKDNHFKAKIATQSGPMLVINGRMNGAFTKGSANLNIRNGVGIINDHKVVFIIATDPCNFYDFAAVFRNKFGCRNALYLDGAISGMYQPDIAPHEAGGNFGAMISVSDK